MVTALTPSVTIVNSYTTVSVPALTVLGGTLTLSAALLDPYIGMPITISTASYIEHNINQPFRATGSSEYLTVRTDGNSIYLSALSGSVVAFNLGNLEVRKPEEVIKQYLKAHVRQNLMPKFRTGLRYKYGLLKGDAAQEMKARALLRDLLTERDWHNYVTNGFIMVRGASGRWYQIPQYQNILVYERGKMIARLCVHTHTDCPPTDHVIAMKTLIEFDEQEVYKRSNETRYSVDTRKIDGSLKEPQRLVELYQSLRGQLMSA